MGKGRKSEWSRQDLDEDKPTFDRGAVVEVTIGDLVPWTGTVLSIKPSYISGWWADVERDGDGVWSVTTDQVKEVASA